MGHYPITVTGRWLDYNTQGVIGYSSGLRVTTNYNHTVTWSDDYNYSFTMYTDENVTITNSHPVYKTRTLVKTATSGYGGTLSLVDWHLTAISGIYVYTFDNVNGSLLDCTVSLVNNNAYLVHNNGSGSKFIAVAPGTHTVLIEKQHYTDNTKAVSCVLDQYTRSVFYMQFKGGTIAGSVSINPGGLGDSGALKNGVKVELLNGNLKAVRQLITPYGSYVAGTYSFYPVPKGTYTIKGSIILTNAQVNDPTDAGTYQGLYGGGQIGTPIEVTTASVSNGCNFTVSKIQ